VEALAGDAACNLLHLMDLILCLLGGRQDFLDLPSLDRAVEIMRRCVIRVEFAE
jgi:hypothetical protein